ncbi:hypothetical protein MYX07_02775 [Patescibacteria group bacterium AH-259-L07]|nr:hypothetical protein [Patescibacteria group bacterium AH-259-L07]
MDPEIKKNIQEKEMRLAFEQQSKQILALPERFIKPENSLKIGFESEMAIIKQGLSSKQIQNVRNSIIEKNPDICGVELGATQIEKAFRGLHFIGMENLPYLDLIAERIQTGYP